MARQAYRRDRLETFNRFDVERILRENIYNLEVENERIEKMIMNVMSQNLSPQFVLVWLRHLESNLAEIIYDNALVQHDIEGFDYTKATIFRRE